MYFSLIFQKKTSNNKLTMENTNKNTTPTELFGGSKFKNDIIFIIILLTVSVTLGAAFFFPRGEGEVVEVRIDGRVTAVYSLSEDITVELDGVGGKNTLVIRDGKAEISYADCPDGICANHKPISRSGESIVCLPHKVVITVCGEDKADTPDLVV